MFRINGKWETLSNLQDVSKIIREYYNYELADELDNLLNNLIIPEHTDDEYSDLECQLELLENELNEKNDTILDLEDKIKELEDEIDELED